MAYMFPLLIGVSRKFHACEFPYLLKSSVFERLVPLNRKPDKAECEVFHSTTFFRSSAGSPTVSSRHQVEKTLASAHIHFLALPQHSITQGYNTFGDLPSYPFIGGAPLVEGWDSPYCGTCWDLTYIDPQGSSWSVIFTAINSGDQGGFSISFAGMDTLTNGNAIRLDGMISVLATQISEAMCAVG
ncbi:Cerato-platanin-domain-containing protein [Boletus reticuloceps]|uniref:Cerato-platanin-domain-containing protein n=1 Tax=Boletus reticuloceps TaxID=495285 RepID=A0A8I2YS45_9AGAM|nr:Cerato-platanin-domain-containing protein [Boletus reticuloceps]